MASRLLATTLVDALESWPVGCRGGASMLGSRRAVHGPDRTGIDGNERGHLDSAAADIRDAREAVAGADGPQSGDQNRVASAQRVREHEPPLFARLAVLRPDLLPLPVATDREETAALRETVPDLSNDESFHDAAQIPGPDAAPPVSFTGLWAPNPSACSPKSNRRQLLPAVINQDGAWAGEVSCSFRSLKQEGNVAVASSTCSNGRRRWTANVRLAVAGDRLTWSSERGSQTYVRCNSRVASMRL
jgi:hypothetical protein